MLVYLVLPLVILYFIFLSRAIILRSNNCQSNEFFVSRNNITLFLWSIVLLVLAVFKGVTVGTDYPMYYNFFVYETYEGIIETGIASIYDLAVKYNNFLIFSLCVYSLFIFFIFKGIKVNSPNYLISILFFVLTYTYFTGYNQLRQMIAVSMLFCFVGYLISNKKIDKIKYIVVILLALLFHKSAAFAFLLFFISKKKFSSKIIIPLFLMTIVSYFIPTLKNEIGQLIIKVSGFYADKYAGKLDSFFEINKEKGLLQLAPVVIQMIILTISLYFPQKKPRLNINYTLYNFSTNIVVINLCLYSLAGIEAIDRLQIYFACFNIYFYSFLTHLLLNSKEKFYGKVFLSLILLFWITYYLLRLIINISGIVPYSFFNG
ncbi:EpsG family protein [Priestia megaterium]|uniref:Putative membrane protein n=1 Tax=Priestia megaterium (strain DSM 319 / IMG 1521) TaxID=592022 RepID=D5DBJ5_PRIM3|nr:EpsG family protein [Priestia megaterium]ADF37977.1 putative membrane protein [Priestia megaterium DSM 319]MED4217269.1 EpsG family protein [Priestia megaterium]WEZ37223.1 EpsG family protein [Priestia megaterium DSM 319]